MSSRPRRVSVTDAARSFADLVNRAYYRNETTILVKNGVEVAYIAPANPSGLPASEALARWRTADHLDAAEVDGVLDAFPVLPFGLAEARVHARLWAALAAKGKMIGAHDLQVAATCLAHGADVATLNTTQFKRVPGLRLADIKRFGRR